MLCYRDMTFCNAECGTMSCPRKFTETDARNARVWWMGMQGEPPVAFSDMKRGCEIYTPKPETA